MVDQPPVYTATDMWLSAVHDRLGEILARLPEPAPVVVSVPGRVELTEPAIPGQGDLLEPEVPKPAPTSKRTRVRDRG